MVYATNIAERVFSLITILWGLTGTAFGSIVFIEKTSDCKVFSDMRFILNALRSGEKKAS